LENYSQTSLTVAGLEPYTGEWTKATAAHLLRRATFGASFTEIKIATNEHGLQGTIENLFADIRLPSPPVLHRQETEPDVQVGETWVTAPHPVNGGKWRGQSLSGWFYLNLMLAPTNIREKMVFFWQNYFGMSGFRDPRAGYKLISLFQEVSAGNFRTMIERITVEPSMLEFLNGDVNDKRNPNENFARELLELYTIQKGDQVAPGDYTTYTEQDVTELARAFTGWRNTDYVFSSDDTPIDSYFDDDSHDTDSKQLSHRFNEATINNAGENEYKLVINIILQQQETSLAFCRELYRFFVYYDITPEVEQNVIAPMGAMLRNNNFEIAPVLKALFMSEHFYDIQIRGAMIKNPHDFVANMYRPFGEFSHTTFGSIQHRYETADRHSRWCNQLHMDFGSPPTVSGWQAYYQAPGFYRNWISTSTIQQRFELVNNLMTPLYHVNGTRLPLNWRGFLASLSNPYLIDDVIADIVLTFLPREITQEQLNTLKSKLIGVLPDAEWTTQYSQYASNSLDNSGIYSFESRVYGLFATLCGMPEFQLQ